MKIIAYSYSDPLFEQTPDPTIWGWEVDRIYQDLGKRFELQQLIHDCQAEPADYLLIRRLEELGDSMQEVSDRVAELEALGIQLIATEQNYNSNANLRADLFLLLQEIQRQQRSRRIRQGHARNRISAIPPPGRVPYGYRRGKDKYALDRSASPVVKDFFEQFLLYGSLRGAVRYLAQKYGKKISVSTGRRWLTNPVYRGDTAYQNSQVLSNTHVPIISREEAAQVDRLLRRNRRLPPRTASAPRSLAGLVVCSECHSPMTVTRVTTPRQDKEYLYLRPTTCPKQPKCRAIPYAQVLEQTIQAICRDLPCAVEEMNLPQMDGVKSSLTDAIALQQEILTQLPTLIENGILDSETAQLRAYKLRTEISELQAKLSTLPPVNLRSVAQAVSIPQFWLDLSESERRFYFREFLRQIKLVQQDAAWQIQLNFIFLATFIANPLFESICLVQLLLGEAQRNSIAGVTTGLIGYGLGGLLLAAVLLFSINLGGLPLRDWDEGTVAQVAREIWRSPAGSWHWLYPTLGGEPYFNKPPLMHWLIALAYWAGGVNSFTTRLPGAMLSAISVPLLYSIGREIFPQRLPAIFSALIYLTMLPVVRHGRLAMLDGAVVCFFLFTILCLLRSRRNLSYCLGVGIGFGLICFTKGILGILLGAIAFLFLLWDTPRLLTSWYLWAGILIGTAPVTMWYAAQWLHYGQVFTGKAIVNQSLRRIWASVEDHKGPPWYYLLEILKYAWPWLLFLPQGLGKTWENRNINWAKLVLVWIGVYLLAISVMGTKLPWYVLPIYPAIALATGVQLADVWNWPRSESYPRAVVAFLALLAMVSWFGSLYFSSWSPASDWEVQVILAALAGTMTLAGVLAARGDRQFLLILFWGMYVSLLLLMTSNHWVWELAEAYPVEPVAAMIQRGTPIAQKIYTSYPYGRPSLDFYSDRQIIPAATSELQHHWQQNHKPYLLLDEATLGNLTLESVKRLGTTEGWTLITKNTNR